ncbi:hypothetical protein LIER_26719 [Lithospermum erythrorhizon]|uniref:Reverse transcriptase RNase H-like domain-containing protein n=1 Tax=Lithospermum erythrorhizon TaxID=34254 RepID=A0AAV3R9E1_LITER
MNPPSSYKDIQKLTGCLAALRGKEMTSACKLKPYFELHPTAVITDQPLKRILTSPTLSRRMTTWAVELSEFNINYVPRKSIKA